MIQENLFKVDDRKVGIHLLNLSIAVVGYVLLGFYVMILVGRKIIDEGFPANMTENVVFLTMLAISMLMAGMFVLFAIWGINIIMERGNLRSMCVSLSQEKIVIETPKKQYSIPISKISHILLYHDNLVVVWNTEDKTVTFNLRKCLFDNDVFQKLIETLRSNLTVIDDISEVKQVQKRLKLNHLFRKNRLEYLLKNLEGQSHQPA